MLTPAAGRANLPAPRKKEAAALRPTTYRSCANTAAQAASSAYSAECATRADHGGDAAVDIGVGGRPARDAEAHGATALPHRPARPARALFLDRGNQAVGRRGRAERDQHLVQDHVIEDLETCGAQLRREASCVGTVILDEARDTLLAERQQCRKHL